MFYYAFMRSDSMKNKIKQWIQINGLEALTIVLLLSLFCVFFWNTHIERIWISLKSLYNSIIYYFRVIFLGKAELVAPPSSYDVMVQLSEGSIFNLLALDFKDFLTRFEMIGHLILTKSFWADYRVHLSDVMYTLSLLLTCTMTLVFCAFIHKKRRKYIPNDTYRDTRFLSFFKTIKRKVKKLYEPVKSFIVNHYSKSAIITCVVLLVAYLQVFPIVVDFISNYFFFTASFDFNVIWKGIVLSLADFLPSYFSFPFLIRLGVLYYIIDRIRLHRADEKLRKMADTNIEYLDSCGNQILINGAPRSGKNALATTLAVLYVQELLPQKLLGIMKDIERKFPFVNYSSLRNEIHLKKDVGVYKNQLDIFSDFFKKKEEFDRTNNLSIFYVNREKDLEEWDELTIESIDHALCDWTLAYFFYSMRSPLAVGNYNVMFNNPINSEPHYFNVAKTDPLQESRNEYLERIGTKVVNYDYMRLGEKFQTYDKNNNYVPDIGCYLITEVGKERGSSETVKKLDGSAKKVNLKNDKFRERLLIWSHISIVRFQTLFKVIADEQRNLGLNAEMRATFESTILIDRRKTKDGLALKSWSIEMLICKLILIKYDKYTLNRSEIKERQTFRNYIIKKIIKPINLYYLRRVNKYSYTQINAIASNGSTEGVSDDVEKKKLYIINKIAHSGRYETANMKKLFLNQMAVSRMSFDDQCTFQAPSPSPLEYRYMNSFAYHDLFGKKEEKE